MVGKIPENINPYRTNSIESTPKISHIKTDKDKNIVLNKKPDVVDISEEYYAKSNEVELSVGEEIHRLWGEGEIVEVGEETIDESQVDDENLVKDW